MKFNNGDRVIVINKDNIYFGLVGTIIGYDYSITTTTVVEFDNNIESHNGGGKGKEGHCAFITEHNLELINS